MGIPLKIYPVTKDIRIGGFLYCLGKSTSVVADVTTASIRPTITQSQVHRLAHIHDRACRAMTAKCVINNLHKANTVSIFTDSLATVSGYQIRTRPIKPRV